MALGTRVKNGLNGLLAPLNLQIASRTAEHAEAARLAQLDAQGHFDAPAFPVLPQFESCDPGRIFDALRVHGQALGKFKSHRQGFSLRNEYFPSPDADAAYAVVALDRPKRIVEIGSGNSTLLFRDAIRDLALETKLVSIDPSPRRAVDEAADEIIRKPVEQVPAHWFNELQSGDILFIDSSHAVCVGGDVVKLVLNILPTLQSGVIVHFHDIFLPFEYPREWMLDFKWQWNEQYLIQALLQGSRDYEVIWPGYFLQKTCSTFAEFFDAEFLRTGSSLWMRKSGAAQI